MGSSSSTIAQGNLHKITNYYCTKHVPHQAFYNMSRPSIHNPHQIPAC